MRRTWAPRGRTPILRHRQRNWARLSMAAMCCYHPDGRRARLAFHVQPGSYNDQLLIGVLGQLRRFLGDQKATLLWDGLRSHWSRPMRARSWPTTPPTPWTTSPQHARRGITRVRRRRRLLFAFLDRTGLSI